MNVRIPSQGACPACLYPISQATPGYTCVCGLEIPALLLEEYRDSSPLVVQLLGWSGHGKSSYLAALGFALSRLGSVWKNYTLRGGTDETQRQLTTAFRLVREGKMPKKTVALESSNEGSTLRPVTVPEHTYLLRNLPEFGNRVVMFHDPAGELCDGLSLPTHQLPFLTRAPISLMFLSADDLDREDFRTMDMLLTSFLHTLQSDASQAQRRSRAVVVVLSKADLLLNQLPPELRQYLVSDPLWPLLLGRTGGSYSRQTGEALAQLGDLELYLKRMSDLEVQLSHWLAEEPPLKTLQLEADRHGVDLRFSLVSATGEEVQGAKPMSESWRPHRVLDPLLWALKLTEGREGLLPEWQRTTRDLSSSTMAMAGDSSEGKVSLLIREERPVGSAGRNQKVNLERLSGDLGAVAPELRYLTFSREGSGVRFRLLSSDSELFVHHPGGVERVPSSEVLIHPGESVSTGDWQVELRSGHFSSRRSNS